MFKLVAHPAELRAASWKDVPLSLSKSTPLMTSKGFDKSSVLPLNLDSVISMSVSVPFWNFCHFVLVTSGNPVTFCTDADIAKRERNGIVTVSLVVIYTIGTSVLENKNEMMDISIHSKKTKQLTWYTISTKSFLFFFDVKNWKIYDMPDFIKIIQEDFSTTVDS